MSADSVDRATRAGDPFAAAGAQARRDAIAEAREEARRAEEHAQDAMWGGDADGEAYWLEKADRAERRARRLERDALGDAAFTRAMGRPEEAE